MPALFLPRLWRRQPPTYSAIDYGNPLTVGLCLVSQPGLGFRETLTGRLPNTIGANLVRGVVTSRGIAVTPANEATGAIYWTDWQPLTNVSQHTLLSVGAPQPNTTHIKVAFSERIEVGNKEQIGFGFNYNPVVDAMSSGAMYLYEYNAGKQLYAVSTSASDGAVRAFAMARNGSAVLSYVDGAAKSTTTSGTGTTTINSGMDVAVGGNAEAIVSGVQHNDPLLLVCAWNRALSEGELKEVTFNPWQLFKPLPGRLYFFPAAAGGATITPDAGSVALTGYAPAVNTTAHQWIDVPAGAVTLTGFAPTVDVGGNVAVNVPLGTITLTGQAPTVVAPYGVDVPAGALSLTGYAPTVVSGVAVAVPAGTVTLTGYAPTISYTAHLSLSVPLGTMTLQAYAPTVLGGQEWTPAASASSIWTPAASASSTWTT